MEIIRAVRPTVESLTLPEELRCPVEECSKLMRSRPNLQMHLARHHGVGKLDRRKNTGERVRYLCPVNDCERSQLPGFEQRRFLQQHYGKVHAPKQYPCSRCGCLFSIKSAAERHSSICGPSVAGVFDHEYARAASSADRGTQASQTVPKSQRPPPPKYDVQTQTVRTVTEALESPLLNGSDPDPSDDDPCDHFKMQNTQTALDELPYEPQFGEGVLMSNLFPDLISLSDTQTQTPWDVDF